MQYLFILLGYVIGATPFGFLAGKLKGIDIREHGSGNVGSTNVVRVLGKKIGYGVFLLDVLKGVLPVFLAKHFAGDVSPEGLVPSLTAIATILGHNYPFWLKFKGGKGIATSAGALIPIMPFTILTAFILWAIVTRLSGYVSLGSIVASLTLPLSILLQGLVTGNWQLPVLGLAAFIGGMAIYKHKANIQRLRDGTENRFTFGKSKKPATS